MRFERGGLIALILVALSHLSCTRQSPPTAFPTSSSVKVQIVLIRGFQDWYSKGVDALATELHTQRLDATAWPEARWQELQKSLVEQPTGQHRLVIIGFSYGADDAVSICRALALRRQSVSLLITIDPVTPSPVPANVAYCINYYQSNGVWDVFPWLRGIPLQAEKSGGPAIVNINLWDHPELLEPHTSHATIAGNANVHAAIVKRVLDLERR